jgi:hypothetical protein
MVAVFITCFTVGSVHAQVVPDLSIWVNTWFKVTETHAVYHFSDIGVKPKPAYPVSESGDISYIKITDWNTTTPGAEFLVADVYEKDPSGGWEVNPWYIYYFAGSNLKFIGTMEINAPTYVVNMLFVFTGKRNKADTKFIMDGSSKLSTRGGSILEIDDELGSTKRFAGTIKLSGRMVPVSKLPSELQGL